MNKQTMNTHATIVRAYATCANGEPQGQARIVEVMKYLGNGWYRVKCVMLDDLTETIVTRYCNINEMKP